jgi:hypothetical protein
MTMLGALLTTRDELIDVLFGSAASISRAEMLASFALSAAVVAFCIAERDALIVSFVSADTARTAGIRVRGLSLLFLATFAVAVALGLRYLGALLMGSLMIIPAATARRLAASLRDDLAFGNLRRRRDGHRHDDCERISAHRWTDNCHDLCGDVRRDVVRSAATRCPSVLMRAR